MAVYGSQHAGKTRLSGWFVLVSLSEPQRTEIDRHESRDADGETAQQSHTEICRGPIRL